ncbi:hypothetical protein Tco_0297604, partial [Tanacetum coccineum]
MTHRQPPPRLPKTKTNVTAIQITKRKNVSHNASTSKSVADEDIQVRLRTLEEMVKKLQEVPENDQEAGCGCGEVRSGITVAAMEILSIIFVTNKLIVNCSLLYSGDVNEVI